MHWAEGSVLAQNGVPTPATVLVVDDDPLNVEMLSALLRQQGYEVTPAYTGDQALQEVATVAPDLILLDAMMPGKDGFVVCSELKSMPDTRFVPVIMVTALAASADRIHGLEVGVDDFISKPVNRLELVARVRSLLRLKGSIDNLESAERVIETLAKAIEARDGYTELHTERVTARALALGNHIHLSEEELDVLYHGCMLHDVGKIGVPEAILGKSRRLTKEEFVIMRRHPVTGVEICRPLRSRLITQALPIIRHHHERIDGQGYPDGLTGEAIPILARIAAISDAYDAMTSDRPYRPGIPTEKACAILTKGAGTQWDASMVPAFVAIVRSEAERQSQPASME